MYATSPSDGKSNRRQIEQESRVFCDVSEWSTQAIVERIVNDQIHIRALCYLCGFLFKVLIVSFFLVVNLSGLTKGARNEIFATRPAPVQISLMGFAGTLAAGSSVKGLFCR